MPKVFYGPKTRGNLAEQPQSTKTPDLAIVGPCAVISDNPILRSVDRYYGTTWGIAFRDIPSHLLAKGYLILYPQVYVVAKQPDLRHFASPFPLNSFPGKGGYDGFSRRQGQYRTEEPWGEIRKCR